MNARMNGKTVEAVMAKMGLQCREQEGKKRTVGSKQKVSHSAGNG